MRRLFLAAVFWAALFADSASAAPIVHTTTVPIGNQRLLVGFSEYPPKAERSIDLTLAPEHGIQNRSGEFKLVQPNGQVYWHSQVLPRFPRDRRVWGLDSIALPTQGNWRLEVVVKNLGSGVIEIPVAERPEGPPNNLIYALSSLPLLALLVLGLRAWWRVRPMQHQEAQGW
jgi:hypothetical protein